MITLVAPCAIGAEKILSNELRQLEFTPISTAIGRVVFTMEKAGSRISDNPLSLDSPNPVIQDSVDEQELRALYQSNYKLRTADRVYLQLATIPCRDFNDLFEGVRAIRWQDWFKRDVRVVVDKVRIKSSILSSEHSIQSVVHKAMYDCLGKAWGMELLPETGKTATVRVYIENNVASILLDLSGMPLHRRGYRTTGGEAPIRETLAAILLHLMQWRRKTPLHDAFCGSGTIPIEAAMYAHNIAPGLGRNFALEDLLPFADGSSVKMMEDERADAASRIVTDCLVRVTGSDISPQAITAAQANAERACVIAGKALQKAGIDARIPRPDFTVSDFKDLAAPYEKGLLLSNPPYGERIGDRGSAKELYSSMHSLFLDFPGWDYGFITNHEEFEVAIGKKATKIRNLKSGNLETRFYIYR
ncbi:MAG TPA: class I SAM-dependent RNA methyltransferase [Treponemataceae bacterium]|nr:class I SAM-dependent RNA methyltransferase [Treponemataceae bacterium]HOS35830.1 class I SAM-dependent RNA methyltransferase [Treponemataceae bacterium]HOU38418.1 class I SAM-dependent RNA methyltransferase [Treponemataceae bacterium]HPL91293.1 class I SAM-dependent RNA methyltransferase [Treponemataceae bacterium]HQF73253.1 class I SAM-dependent RNA methyltransferase [Treponemataceae bacterium]